MPKSEPNNCEFKRPIPLECPCGFTVKMGFGSPETARKILELIKIANPQDRFHAAAAGGSNN